MKKKSKAKPLTAAKKARIDRELIESRAEPFADAAVIHKDNGDLLKMSKKLTSHQQIWCQVSSLHWISCCKDVCLHTKMRRVTVWEPTMSN